MSFAYYVEGSGWIDYESGNTIATGQVGDDAATVERDIEFTPFLASRMKFSVPINSRSDDTTTGIAACAGRLEYSIVA